MSSVECRMPNAERPTPSTECRVLHSTFGTRHSAFASLILSACIHLFASPGYAAPLSIDSEPIPQTLTLDAAVRWALEHNPELAALRQQHGIAAAAVIIADTYPHNPILESKIRAAEGPRSAGITNRVSNEHKILMDIEIRNQGGFRRAGAAAALSRTEWEIAFQETALGVRVVRAFNAVLYHQERLKLDEEGIRLNELAVEQTKKLFDQGKARAADSIMAGTDVDDVKLHLKQARGAYIRAAYDLRRALGLLSEELRLEGTLGVPGPAADQTILVKKALEWRADLHARQMAVTEADARLRLVVADRYGNPNIGPAYEYDPAGVNLIGIQVSMPLPAFNTRRGEIMQREAERGRAALELRQTEVQIEQDVQAALARLQEAQTTVAFYQSTVIPRLEKGLKDFERLFEQGEPGLDLTRISELRRRLLLARDGYLDALLEVNEARADLAAALGSPVLAAANPQDSQTTPVIKP